MDEEEKIEDGCDPKTRAGSLRSSIQRLDTPDYSTDYYTMPEDSNMRCTLQVWIKSQCGFMLISEKFLWETFH